MGKNSFLQSKYLSKNNVALFCVLLMFAGFLMSRSISSLGIFLFGVNALRDVHPKRWLKERWWLLGLGWVILFAVSWFWSADKGEWAAHVQEKLPFLLLPLAFAFMPPWSPKALQQYTWIFLGAMTAGAGYSLSFLWRDPTTYITGYFYSHLLPTPAYRDHISFSMAVAVCICWCIYQWPFVLHRASRWIMGILVAFLSLYLHILAAKTGLLALYLFFFGWIIYLLFSGKWVRGVLIISIMVCGAFGAYRFIPTLHQRIGYMSWSWIKFREGERTGNYSDMGRVISYRISERIIRQHPVAGVGAGDMLDEMKKGYDQWYPDVEEEQRLIPHNQFLTDALAAGIPAALLFGAWILAPLLLVRRNRDGFFFLITWIMLLVPLLADPFLEVQFGVFVYLFFLLWQRVFLLHRRGPGPAQNPQIS